MKRKPGAYTVIDLFSGAGGASCGFKKNPRFDIRFAVDAQSAKPSSPPGSLACNATYAANMGLPVHEADLSAYDPQALLQATGLRPGDLDVLISCAPCTGFSRTLRDNHLRDDPRNFLVERSGLFVAHLRPKILLMENARELLRGNFKHHADRLTEHLQRLGYSVLADVHMLSRFGLPQVRERALVVAVRDVTVAADLNDLWRGWRVAEQAITVRRAIAHLPTVAAGQVHAHDPMHAAPGFGSPLTLKRLRATPKNGGSWADLLEHPNATELLTPGMQKLAAQNKWGSYPDVYGRLSWDRPAPTIKRECAHIGNGRYAHPEQHRLCTVREMALLNGFPADYLFAGSLTNRYRHIGDAVPPLISYQLSQLCAWMLSGHKPDIGDCVLKNTSLRPEDIHAIPAQAAYRP